MKHSKLKYCGQLYNEETHESKLNGKIGYVIKKKSYLHDGRENERINWIVFRFCAQ